jgi:hypothetical protein
MNNAFLRRAGVACLAFVAVAALLLILPTARLKASSSGVLDACVNPGNGMMRLVDSSTACHANETFVEWNITGPQGPAGPQGPPGASSGGPPFTWVCTPGNYDLGNNSNAADLDIFNGSSTTAHVAAHFLAFDGTNLAGSQVPGEPPGTNYPGQTGSTTVPLAPQNTLIIPYDLGSGTRTGNSGLLATIVVVSDQPIVVGYNIPFGALQATPCSLLPK